MGEQTSQLSQTEIGEQMGELSSHLSQTEMGETKMGALLDQHGRGRMGEHTSHLSQTEMGYMRMGDETPQLSRTKMGENTSHLSQTEMGYMGMGEETSQLSRTKMGGRMTDGGSSGPDLSSQRHSHLIGGTKTDTWDRQASLPDWLPHLGKPSSTKSDVFLHIV